MEYSFCTLREGVNYKNHPTFNHIICGDDGSVYSKLRGHRLLKGSIDKKGYVKYCIKRNAAAKLGQRLIMETFIGPSKLTVDHLNMVKTDNRLCNLEYVSAKENTLRYMKNCRKWDSIKGEKNVNAKITEQIARQIKQMRISGIKCREISQRLGLGYSIVKEVYINRSWRCVAI